MAGTLQTSRRRVDGMPRATVRTVPLADNHMLQNTSPEIRECDEYKKEREYLAHLISVSDNAFHIRVGMTIWKRQHYTSRHFDPMTKSFFIFFDFKSIPLDAPYEQCDEDFEWPPESGKVPKSTCQAGICRNPLIGRSIIQCVALHKNVQCEKLVHENCSYNIKNKNRFCCSRCCKAVEAAPPSKGLLP